MTIKAGFALACMGLLIACAEDKNPQQASHAPFFPRTDGVEDVSIVEPQEPLSLEGGISAIVGTWKLEGSDKFYWSIRLDGTYRAYGVFLGGAYRGAISITDNQFRLAGPGWTDSGTLELSAPDVLSTQGKMGVSHWRRLWWPGAPHAPGDGDRGVCDIISLDEVAKVLAAPIKAPQGLAMGGNPRVAIEKCRYSSTIDARDRIEISTLGGPFLFRKARKDAEQLFEIPGLGTSAFADLGRTGMLNLYVLRGENQITLTLRLASKANVDDVPVMAELARLAHDRFRLEWAR